MPITNWHSARLQDPAKFDSKTWKTTAGGTIYGSKKIPFSINIIWGKLKEKAKPADPPIAQALRFPMSKYTAVTAKAFLKKNKIKYASFEAGKKGAIAATAQMAGRLLIYPKEIPPMAPVEAFLSLRAELEKAVSYKFGKDAFVSDFSNKEVIIGYSKSDIRGLSSWESGEYDKTAYKLVKKVVTFSGPVTKVTKSVSYESFKTGVWNELLDMEDSLSAAAAKAKAVCQSCSR